MGALGDTVLHELDGGVATITMCRPDAGNALLPEQRDAIIDLLGQPAAYRMADDASR